jgi:carbamate kinase
LRGKLRSAVEKRQKVLVALGGNALSKNAKASAERQEASARRASRHLVKLLSEGYQLLITHGNGPQVGDIFLRNEIAKEKLPPDPLDVCGAESQGMVGYILQQALYNALKSLGGKIPVATILTSAIVDARDPAFKKPSKPIGPFYLASEAARLMKEKRWKMLSDSGRGYRRVVPSPKPIAFPELPLIKELFDQGFLVIQSGGGGIPVIAKRNGELVGVEAVIDKDLSASLMASLMKMDVLLILTDVDKVSLNYGTPNQKQLDEVSVAECKEYLAEGQFPAGSMGPKIQAAVDFASSGKRRMAVIASLEKGDLALAGRAGTRIV